jgi:hypothetical protein
MIKFKDGLVIERKSTGLQYLLTDGYENINGDDVDMWVFSARPIKHVVFNDTTHGEMIVMDSTSPELIISSNDRDFYYSKGIASPEVTWYINNSATKREKSRARDDKFAELTRGMSTEDLAFILNYARGND